MASYYDTYDSRPRSSRRNDSFSRTRNDAYYSNRTAAASETGWRGGETYSSQRNSNGYLYDGRDNRHGYPPPLPPDTGRPPRREASRLRKRRSWPPQPLCEDVVTSLAKEAGTQRRLSWLIEHEVPSRGTIDQEPVVDDVPELIPERRFVLAQNRPGEQSTPPTSEDEKARRRARRRSSMKLDINTNKLHTTIPEMDKRTASPYAFSRSDWRSEDDVPSQRYVSSDDLLSPPPIESNVGRTLAGSKSQPVSPRRDSARYSLGARPNKDYFAVSNENAIEDDDYYDVKSRPSEKSARRPSTRATLDVHSSSKGSSVVDFASQPKPASIRRANLDARRNTDTESTLPTLQRLKVEKTRRPTPLMTGSALSGLGVPVVASPRATLSASDNARPRSRDSSYNASKDPSPAGSTVGLPDALRRQARASSEIPRENGYDRPPTRESSASSSRPQSPSPRTPSESPRLPKTELDWSTLLAANANRRSIPPSRLSSYMQQEHTPPPSRGYARQSASTTVRVDSLPYPVNDGPATPTAWMPSEEKHQYFPGQRAPQAAPLMQEPTSYTFIRTDSPGPGTSSYSSASTSRTARPSFPKRYSTADLPEPSRLQQKERPLADETRRTAAVPSSQTKKDLQALAKKGLPACARTKPVAGYSEWYMLTAAPSLEFCPDCISDVFDRTLFRTKFRRSPPRSLDDPVRCALGGKPWIRLAWLMTLQQQRLDLGLLEYLAEIEETSSPCAGDQQVARSWYTLRDKNGHFIKDFHICYSDVRKIEALMPSLQGMFVPLSSRTADEVHICAIRPEGSRFSIYIDALLTTHEKATAKRSNPDLGPFISLVQWRSRLRECSRDGLIHRGLWHFIPSLPELTVCEDCFATVVEPEIEKDNDLAMRFNRTIQPVYEEGIPSSCQLYSPRMRKVFERAIRNKDYRYLVRKAKERREAEVRLQHRYRAVIQKAKRVSWEVDDSRDDERRLQKELDRIGEEWKLEWE